MVLCFDKGQLVDFSAGEYHRRSSFGRPSVKSALFITTYVDPGLGAALASSSRTAHR